MDLNEVVVFIKVVQKGGFSAAAQALQMPKSTVSLKISNLEDRLGVTLLKRTTRKIQLTDLGRKYFESTIGAIDEIVSAEHDLLSDISEPQGRLRITAPVDLGNNILCEVCSVFRNKYPKVHFDLLLTNKILNIMEEDIDIAIRAGVLQDSSFMAKKIGDVSFEIFSSKEYIKQKGIPKIPQDLTSHDCILFSSLSSTHWKLQKEKKEIVIPITPKILVNDINLAHQFALMGEGIALLPSFLVKDDVKEGRLKRVLTDWKSNSGPIHFVYPSQKYRQPKVSAFIEMSVNIMKKRFQV